MGNREERAENKGQRTKSSAQHCCSRAYLVGTTKSLQTKIPTPHSPFPTPHSLLPILCSIFLLSSCQSIPKLPDTIEASRFPLEKGANVYLIADVPKARAVLEMLPIPELKTKQTAMLLDKTRTAAAALYPQESGKKFQVAAWGAYPAFRANMAFTFSGNWKKTRSDEGAVYRYSKTDKISVALDSSRAFAASWIDTPVSPITDGAVEIPEGFGEFRKGAILSLWLDEPGAKINRLLSDMGLPVQAPVEKIFINLFDFQTQYEAVIRLRFPGASQARGAAALLNLARNFMGTPEVDEKNPASLFAALLFAGTPVLNGADIDINTGALTEKEMTLLFNMFLLY